jgi:amidase
LYSYAMNFMGLPAAIVQANENDGQPVGVQIVGRRFREDMILDAAQAPGERHGPPPLDAGIGRRARCG